MVEHFAKANPEGEEQGNVPALLRRVADSIDLQGVVDVQDVVVHGGLDEKAEDRRTMTVFSHRASVPLLDDLAAGAPRSR